MTKASVLGVGCGTPLHHASVKGETVVDLGSGAGIDVFSSANKVGGSGKVIGIDMTDEMLESKKVRKREWLHKCRYQERKYRKKDLLCLLVPALFSAVISNLWLYWPAIFVGTSIVALILRKKFVGR